MGISSQSSTSAKQTNQIVKMKFLVIISAFLAVSSGSIVPYAGVYGGYGYPLADGVAARADHLAAKGAAYAAAGPALAYGAGYGYGAVAPGPVVAAAPAIAAPVPAIAPVPAVAYGYAGPLADALPAGAAGLVAHPNGAVTPADTPSVVAARADHLAARGAAYAAAAPVLAYGAAPAFAAPAIAAPAIAAPAIAA